MTGKEVLDYLSHCTEEQLSKPFLFEQEVDDDDGGHSVLKELYSCNWSNYILDSDWTKDNKKPAKGFNCTFF